MTAITVSVGGHSRNLAGIWVVALGLAVAAILVAAGLVAGRWSAPTVPTGPTGTVVRSADQQLPIGITAYPCAVGRPC